MAGAKSVESERAADMGNGPSHRRGLYTSAGETRFAWHVHHVRLLMPFNKIRFSASTRRAKQAQRVHINTARLASLSRPSLVVHALAHHPAHPTTTPLLLSHYHQWPPSPPPLPARLPLPPPPRPPQRRLPSPRPRRRRPRLLLLVVRTVTRRSVARRVRRPTRPTSTRVRFSSLFVRFWY